MYIPHSRSQNNSLDSLIKISDTDKFDTATINNLNKISWSYLNSGNYVKAVKYAQEATQKAEQMLIVVEPGDLILTKKRVRNLLAKSICNTGLAMDFQGNYRAALKNYFRALEIYKEEDNKTAIALAYDYIGNAYSGLMDYPNAIKYLFEAYQINKKLNNLTRMSGNLSNLAIVYSEKGEEEKVIEFFIKALKIEEERGDSTAIAERLSNAGGFYHNHKQYHKALEFYNKELNIAQSLKNKQLITNAFSDLAALYDDLNKNDSALLYYKKSIQMSEEIDSKANLVITLCNMANFYTDLNKFDEAEQLFKKSMQISMASANWNGIKNNHEFLTHLYKKQKKWKKALEHYRNFVIMRDSIYNEEYSRKAVSSEMYFEYSKKEDETRIMNEKKEALTQTKSAEQKIAIVSSSVLLLMVLVFVLLIFRGYLHKKKASVEIENQKQIIEKKQTEIIDSLLYAKRIQNAMITPENYISKNLNRLMKN